MGIILLSLAFALIGLVVGYMVGGSTSPVAAATIPAVVGIVTAAMSAATSSFAARELQRKVDAVTSSATSPNATTLTALSAAAQDLARTAKRLPSVLGLITLAFIITYIVGLWAGTYARLDGAAARFVSPIAGVWAEDSAPNDIVSSMYWISTEQQLRQAGVERETIRELYDTYLNVVDEEAQELAGEGQAVSDSHRRDAALLLLGGLIATPAPEGSASDGNGDARGGSGASGGPAYVAPVVGGLPGFGPLPGGPILMPGDPFGTGDNVYMQQYMQEMDSRIQLYDRKIEEYDQNVRMLQEALRNLSNVSPGQ